MHIHCLNYNTKNHLHTLSLYIYISIYISIYICIYIYISKCHLNPIPKAHYTLPGAPYRIYRHKVTYSSKAQRRSPVETLVVNRVIYI